MNMIFKPKFVTVDDFKNFIGKDLRALLKSDDNESNEAERFLMWVEDHLMSWVDRNTFRVIPFNCLTSFQLENFQKAILFQAWYTYKQGSVALGLESGFDAEKGIVIDYDKLAQIEVCQAAINYLGDAGLFNLNIRNKPRVMRGYPGLELGRFDGGGIVDPQPKNN